MDARVGAALVFAGCFYGRAAAAAPVYDQVVCCYSNTGSCTVMPGQVTISAVPDASCATPTGSAWLLEVQAAAPVVNPHFSMQTAEGAGWRGICPSIGDLNGQLNIDFCLAETGSPPSRTA
jgi:hypothetical protein